MESNEMIESGVIKKEGTGSKAALVYGQMNEPPGARARSYSLYGWVSKFFDWKIQSWF